MSIDAFARTVFDPLRKPPGKIICVGMNYTVPGAPPPSLPYPALFLKASSTIIGPGSAIQIPATSDKVFCEGEVAVVIGRQGRHIPKVQAWDYIVGLSIANDVGAEDLEARSTQWQTGKLPDTFLPIGPRLVPLAEIPDPSHLEIELFINDRLALRGHTGEMIFNIPTLIAYISDLATLYPGDILVTGSPKGLGDLPAPKAYVRPGDVVTITITGLGSLRNPVHRERS